MAGYRLIAGEEHRTETEIRRSRFIATVARAASEAEARAVIDRIRSEHWQANHNCSALADSAMVAVPSAAATTANRPARPASRCSRSCGGAT